MKRKTIDLAGRVFGRLTVISFVHRDLRSQGHWKCRCRCGNIKVIQYANLTSGSSKSCGCLQRELISNRMTMDHTTHGMYGTKTYHVWANMIQRCANPNHKSYHNYGGRGIKVCERWADFKNFLDDMGERPDGLSIERKNNNGGYSPCNCKWATRKEQNRNTRRNRPITYKGETKILVEWARQFNLSREVLSSRLSRGWDVERALNTETQKRRIVP